jgi:hypothetical protein
VTTDAWAAARRLSDALEREDFEGRDPYDALSSPVLRRVARGRLARGAAIQALRRSPVDVRVLLGVSKRRHAKGLALCISAYARLARLEPDGPWAGLARSLAEDLAGRASPEGGFGYDFDVQTRWGYYRAGEPNAVVTSFAGHALLDAGLADPAWRAVDWALSRLPVEADGGTFFAYHEGSLVPIHNASLLVASLAARAGRADEARAAVAFTVERQRPDGSWPYGEAPGLEWVDGYHTMYVLDALAGWEAEAVERGLRLYLERLIDPDGAPRATLDSRYPLEAHAAGTAIGGLAGLGQLEASGRVLDWTLRTLARPDGRFAFRQGRVLRNRTAYIRWNDGHVLLGLARYLEAAS